MTVGDVSSAGVDVAGTDADAVWTSPLRLDDLELEGAGLQAGFMPEFGMDDLGQYARDAFSGAASFMKVEGINISAWVIALAAGAAVYETAVRRKGNISTSGMAWSGPSLV